MRRSEANYDKERTPLPLGLRLFPNQPRNMNEILLTIAALVVVIIVVSTVVRFVKDHITTHTVWDYQTGLHYRYGRFIENLEAGRHRFWGAGHSVIVLDNRIAELVVQGQELITADSATVKLTAVAQWKIADPKYYTDASDNPNQALYTRVQLALRKVVTGLELDEVMEQKAAFGETLLGLVKESARVELGIEVLTVEIRDVMLAGEVKNAFSSVLLAKKEAQAKQERARGEAAALRTMANAARAFENNPELFRLRYLETLKEASAGYGNQLIIGVPDELMALVKKE